MGWSSERLLEWQRTPAVDFSGAYKIQGQTLKGGVAFRARVMLFGQNSVIPLREAWSESDGSWSFTGLRAGTYIVIAIDKSGERNAGVYSHVTAVAM